MIGITPEELKDVVGLIRAQVAAGGPRMAISTEFMSRFVRQFGAMRVTLEEMHMPVCSKCGCIEPHCTCFKARKTEPTCAERLRELADEKEALIVRVTAMNNKLAAAYDELLELIERDAIHANLGYVLPQFEGELCARNCQFLYRNVENEQCCTLQLPPLQETCDVFKGGPHALRCQRCIDAMRRAEDVATREREKLESGLGA